jgi:CubicO group peptidase (beta-lactamase class C family)
VAVAVVVGDEVVLSKGYGLRDVEEKLPMAAETQMPIASVTKQFTVAALGTLVRQGKLDWDKPVRDYLPDFRLHNEYATSHTTPRTWSLIALGCRGTISSGTAPRSAASRFIIVFRSSSSAAISGSGFNTTT